MMRFPPEREPARHARIRGGGLHRSKTSSQLLRFALGGALILSLIAVAFALRSAHFNSQERLDDADFATHGGVANAEELLIRNVPPPSHPRPTKGTQFYVAPDGSAQGDGSKQRPWDLATALAQPRKVKAGDTIWLRGGFYEGAFTSELSGTEKAPIMVCQFTNERATIDGSLTVHGSWTTYWGFEVMNTDPVRDEERATGIEVDGAHTKFINLVVHDTGNGFGLWTPAVDAELYGNIIYNNGWQSSDADRGHGHGIYTQNETGTKFIRDNIIFNQFGWGIHAYTEEGTLNGLHFEGNVSFNNGAATQTDERYDNILVGGNRPAERIALISNYTYHTPTKNDTKPNVRLHYEARNNRDLIVKDNYFAGGSLVASVGDWQAVTMTGNTFFGLDRLMKLRVPQSASDLSYVWDENTYYQRPGALAFNFQEQSLDFAGWQKVTGFDRNSRGTSLDNGRPVEGAIFVRPNRYEPGRAHLIVYNWGLKSVVEAAIGNLLPVGARYEVRSAQNYFGAPVLTGTYDNRPLRLPMSGGKAAQIVGGDRGLRTIAPEFEIFVMLQVY